MEEGLAGGAQEDVQSQRMSSIFRNSKYKCFEAGVRSGGSKKASESGEQTRDQG